MRRALTLSMAVVAVVVVAVGGGATAAAGAPIDAGTSAEDVETDSWPADIGTEAPPADVEVAETAADCDANGTTELIGCWNGVHYSDDLDIDQGDGLTEAELEQLTHRKMARVEHLRERPFESEVPVDTITREEFQADRAGGDEETAGEREFNRWNDQVWKALFVVGEDDSSAEAIDTVFGGAVAGFYSPAEDRVVIVVEEGDDLQISGSTLVHELGHAMQDQYHNLGDERYVGATQDADLAVDGIVEGEVVHLEELYDERCEGNWSCLGEPDSEGNGGAGDLNFGILQTVLQPYSDGPFYAADLVEDGGWDAVNETMNDPPETTSEVIHREPDYETTEIEFEDTATNGWEPYPNQGVGGADTVGEASMFVMFWYQAFEYEAPTFSTDYAESVNVHLDIDEELRTRTAYNYAHSATEGWAGDELYPYRNDAGDDERDGYVWVTEWQTEADAAEFHETYLRMVDHHGAEPVDGGVLDVATGDFRGAYGVEHDGTTVTIAHAPTAEDVFDLRPDIDLDVPDDVGDGTPEDGDETTDDDDADETPGDDGDEASDDDATAAPDGDEEFDGEAPGLGVVTALAALLAAAALLVRRA